MGLMTRGFDSKHVALDMGESDTPDFPVREVEGCAVVVASGEIDVYTAPALRESLVTAGNASARAVVDLSAVTFLDSTGLGVLLSALNGDGDRQPASLVLVRPCAMVLRVLHVTGLADVFRICDTVEEAVSQPA